MANSRLTVFLKKHSVANMSNMAINSPEFQRKNVEKKMRMVSELFDFAFELKWHQFKSRYPDKTKSEIKQIVLESIERGCRS